jgi:hypothetical protein
MSPAVKEIRDLQDAISQDQARIAEINVTIARNERKRSAFIASLTPDEAAELNPPAAEATVQVAV